MKKTVELWTVKDLQEFFGLIHFPEYQREPNLWSLAEKQRLIDSMIRQFDIASIYLYAHQGGVIDCVDGRQRIGAIMSFVGRNPDDRHNNFEFRRSNEIASEEPGVFGEFDGQRFLDIYNMREENQCAAEFIDRILGYSMTTVMLSKSAAVDEFNLQFTRLNLGVIINSGEKLNAMVGQLRDICFGPTGLAAHPFLRMTGMPIRRFAHAQLAAQILAQVFAKEDSGSYARARHFDLQRLFKRFAVLDARHTSMIAELRDILDLLEAAFQQAFVLRSRAMIVSIVLLAWERKITATDEAKVIEEFGRDFMLRLNWQIKKGVQADEEYYYLVEFQRQVTQASVERPAVTKRSATLEAELQRWKDSRKLRGDSEWSERHGGRSAREAAMEETKA